MIESEPTNTLSANVINNSHSETINGIIEDLTGKDSPIINDATFQNSEEKGIPKKKTITPKPNNAAGKTKKRKQILRDTSAPKQPLTGYFRFLNDRRETVRNENPSMPFSEITKQLATEWNTLPVDAKKHYLDAAEKDKERYSKEFEEYKKTDAYKTFLQKKQAKKKKEQKKVKTEKFQPDIDIQKIKNKKKKESKKKKKDKDSDETFEIPIFTQEFLEHNKQCEAEIRELRKVTTDYESQNSVLELHIERLKTAIERLEADTNERKEQNKAMKEHLDTLTLHFIPCFANIAIPGFEQGASVENIDSYVQKLDILLMSEHESPLRSVILNAVSQLDFSK